MTSSSSAVSAIETTKAGAVAKDHASIEATRVPADVARCWPYEVDQAPVLKIGQVVDELEAEFPALTISKVRYLEDAQLISPYRKGGRQGHRRYSRAHVERLRYILTRQRDDLCHLQAIGQTLSELDQGIADETPAVGPQLVTNNGELVVNLPNDQLLSVSQLAKRLGVSIAQIEQVVTARIAAPDAKGRFDARTAQVVRLALEISKRGIPLRNLRSVSMAADREAELISSTARLHTRGAGQDSCALGLEIAQLVSALHTTLLEKAVVSDC
jgi:transcriptional regulator, merR family protein